MAEWLRRATHVSNLTPSAQLSVLHVPSPAPPIVMGSFLYVVKRCVRAGATRRAAGEGLASGRLRQGWRALRGEKRAAHCRGAAADGALGSITYVCVSERVCVRTCVRVCVRVCACVCMRIPTMLAEHSA